MKIKYASANYTGGGIYEYVGILDNGNYFIAYDDGSFRILNEYPNDEQTGGADWQEAHLIDDITDTALFNEMLEWIISHGINEDGSYYYHVAINNKHYVNVYPSRVITH